MPQPKTPAPDAAAAAMAQAAPSRLRLALGNAWNLAALAACGGLAFLTRNPVPLVAGVALEAGWLALATRPRASALFFASHHAEAARVSARAHRAGLVASLSSSDRDRVLRLEKLHADILDYGARHPHADREARRAELTRLTDLLDQFVEAVSQPGHDDAVGELRAQIDDTLDAPFEPLAVPPSEIEDRARRREPLPADVANARRG